MESEETVEKFGRERIIDDGGNKGNFLKFCGSNTRHRCRGDLLDTDVCS